MLGNGLQATAPSALTPPPSSTNTRGCRLASDRAQRNGGQRVVSRPNTETRPSRGGVSPIRLRSVVVLPAPSRPSRAVT